jgi:hypothetical protein
MCLFGKTIPKKEDIYEKEEHDGMVHSPIDAFCRL